MIRTTVIICLISAVALGCKQNHRQGFTKTICFPNGNIDSIIEYDSAGRKHGTTKSFYSNGQLAVQVTFEHGKMNGEYIEYYQGGGVKEHCRYLHGDILGSYYRYYVFGKIKQYNSIDYQGNVLYVLKFDSTGKKAKEEGLAVSPVASSPMYKKQYYKGDSIVLQYCIAQPPGYRPKAFIGVYWQKQLIQPFAEYSIDKFSLTEIRYQFKDTGFYAVACIGEITDTFANWRKRDTTFSELIVR